MNRPQRACARQHPNPRQTPVCGICRFAVAHPGFYAGDQPAPAAPAAPPGLRTYCRHCPSRGVWDWSVWVGNERKDGGYDEDEAEARAALAAAVGRHRPAGILLTGGIGDLFAVELVMPADLRARLGTAYYAAPAAAELKTLLAALPNYPRLKNHVILPTGQQTLYDLRGVVRAVGPVLPAGTEDWSIGTVFPRRLPETGSSFLAHRLAAPALPDRPYVVVVPHSTWGRWADRDFNADDWRALFAFLETHDLAGVVLCRERLPLPSHPRLLDWQGRTSILESVELLKAARGYLGVDSCLSVLAARQFPPARLAVKGFREHLLANLASYYGPRADYPFVRPRLEAPPWT